MPTVGSQGVFVNLVRVFSLCRVLPAKKDVFFPVGYGKIPCCVVHIGEETIGIFSIKKIHGQIAVNG